MEAMNLGSPVGAAVSPASHNTPNQSAYIPGYLLGDTTPSASPAASQMWSSPNTTAQKSFSKAATPFANYSPHTPQPSGGSYVGTPRAENRPNRDILGSRTKEKSSAPPVRSLLESVIIPSGTPDKRIDSDLSLNNSRLNQTGSLLAPGTPRGAPTNSFMCETPGGQDSSLFNQSRKNPPSPAQVDPFYTQGESIGPDDELDETWVTIFGFPPAASSFILQQFSQYGNITKHIISPDGNWMHLHFQSKLQAKKALSKNGKVFGNSIMVGVTACIDKSVMADVQDVSNLHHSSFLDSSYARQSTPGATRDNHAPIRPLTAAYKAASSEHEVLNAQNAPQKNNNIVSKAMEYMFGW
ncbi:hypothetical protein CAPTEDRAFT_171777 [Capitella teleta]|uniref:Nucleoporin NUP53 n=1 Tax=Capitella teleta TaxID=283909 RepID=R7TL95_CAPTE|nr:hypothetical protein CAPTEDRAFT_171777 [Capitella teleta]|eukprot:ELT94444.1 hypothetical protein CAPTEDRAFT_171777 [Capitella teleta]